MKAGWVRMGLVGLLLLSGMVAFGVGGVEEASAIGVGQPWYFAEGRVDAYNFHEYLCIGNTTNDIRVAQVTYVFADGTSDYREYVMSPYSRFTIYVNGEVGDSPPKDVSLQVFTGDTSVIPERVMYFNYNGWCTGGHAGMGVTYLDGGGGLAFFAEGYTGAGFDQWLLVANFSTDTEGEVTFTFQTEEAGEIVKGPFTVPPNTRKTWKVNDLLGPNFNNSVMVTLDKSGKMAVERAMYFNYQGVITDGTCVSYPGPIGSVYGASSEQYFAEGCTRNNGSASFDTWFTVQNIHDFPVDVRVTYLLAPGQGDPVVKDYTVPAKHRKTIYAANDVGKDKDFGAKLESLTLYPGETSRASIYAERPMYFNYPLWCGNRWVNCDGGHCVASKKTEGAHGIFPEGYTGVGFDEWLLVVNFEDVENRAIIKYYMDTGEVQTSILDLPPKSRYTIKVNDVVGPNQNVSVDFASHTGGTHCERSMYFMYNGAWTGGTGRF